MKKEQLHGGPEEPNTTACRLSRRTESSGVEGGEDVFETCLGFGAAMFSGHDWASGGDSVSSICWARVFPCVVWTSSEMVTGLNKPLQKMVLNNAMPFSVPGQIRSIRPSHKRLNSTVGL